MSASNVRIGSFVWASGALKRRGIGKVLDRAPGTARVEYFYSISRRVVETVEDSQVNVIQSVSPQTRCYVALDSGRWLMGRLGRRVDAEYEVFSRQGGV